jgi:ActR/RegA family two-component response regulator
LLNGPAFPTVLLALEDPGSQEQLSRGLQNRGYLVLEARNLNQALEVVRTHSRSIHLLLLGIGPDNRLMAREMKQYRPSMKILFVETGGSESGLRQTSPDLELKAITELGVPPARAVR